jgi:DNA-binding SARP family transcriptional activator
MGQIAPRSIGGAIGAMLAASVSRVQANVGPVTTPNEDIRGWLRPSWPPTIYELIFVPVYLLYVLIGLLGLVTKDWAGIPYLIVGLVGMLYPTRKLVIVASTVLAALLVAALFYGLPIDYNQPAIWLVLSPIWIPAVAVLVVGAVLAWWADGKRQQTVAERARVARLATTESADLERITRVLRRFKTEPPLNLPGLAGTITVTDLIAGELNRRFDTHLEAAINGSLDHHLQTRSLGVGISFGSLSLGRALGSASGFSSVELGVAGTTREDVAGDSFMAVLEKRGPDGGDTLRMVVPSGEACRDYVRQMLYAWQRSLGINSKRELAVRVGADGLPERLAADSSYVGDRLASMARLAPGERPLISVVGLSIDEHTILGAGIRIGEGPWLQLFPAATLSQLTELVAGAEPTPPPQPPSLPPQGPPGATEPTSIVVAANGLASASVNGSQPAAAVLRVTTIGGLQLRVGDDELTRNLSQKPVLIVVWLYLLARALRSPQDSISRAALADELFPGLDPERQRARLRDRLSDLQNLLPPAVARCIVAEGDRVRFELSQCDVDVQRLRAAAESLRRSQGMVDPAVLGQGEKVVSSIGDGEFLPEWEAYEAKLTGGRSGTSEVIDQVRAAIHRSLTELLVGLAEAHVARRQPDLAIPLLERAHHSQPDSEGAAKQLIAAYLLTGQTSRAEAIKKELA